MTDSANDEPEWSYAKIGWLLDQVSEAGADIPSHFYPENGSDAQKARDELGNSISMAFTFHAAHKTLTKRAETRVNDCKSLRGQLEKALSKLDGDSGLRPLLAERLRFDAFTTENEDKNLAADQIGLFEVERYMQKLLQVTIALQTQLSGEEIVKALPRQSQLIENLAGAYEQHLGGNAVADINRTRGAYNGSFVAFVRASFRLAGKLEKSDSAMTEVLRTWLRDRA